MKFFLSEVGQCIVFGILLLILIMGFNDILEIVTGG